MNELIIVVLLAISGILSIGGVIFYKKLRMKMDGVIGVGGAYVITTVIMLMLISITQLFFGFGKKSSLVEVIVSIIFMVICLAYMVKVMLLHCNSRKEMMLLPIMACMIAFGFVGRLMLAMFLHIPMEDRSVEKRAKFPTSIMSPKGENFKLENDSGDNASYYCPATGQRVYFRDVDFEDGYPTGWYQA